MLCKLTPDKLSVVSYDPLTHLRHNAGDRSVNVGHELKRPHLSLIHVDIVSGVALLRNAQMETSLYDFYQYEG